MHCYRPHVTAYLLYQSTIFIPFSCVSIVNFRTSKCYLGSIFQYIYKRVYFNILEFQYDLQQDDYSATGMMTLFRAAVQRNFGNFMHLQHYLKNVSTTGFSLGILWNFLEKFFYIKSTGDCFCLFPKRISTAWESATETAPTYFCNELKKV